MDGEIEREREGDVERERQGDRETDIEREIQTCACVYVLMRVLVSYV